MRRRVIVTMLTAVVLAASVVAQVPQRDTRPAPSAGAIPPAPTGTATVGGSVIADATQGPIGFATVVLIGTRTGVLKVTSTDRAGTFRFTALPADSYTIGASKLPHLGAVAGARRPVRPGSNVVVPDGATVNDVLIRLPLGAALSGTITDVNGLPASGVSVLVYQRRVQNGERILVRAPTGILTTDERGRYRAFGLPPGEYLVTAAGTHQPVPVRTLTEADVDAALAGRDYAPMPIDDATAVAPVYYPGTTRVSDALGILVAAGDDRQNLDFRLERVRAAQISGTVSTADGSPLPPSLSIMATGAPGASPLSTAVTSRTTPDGQFTLPNQIPNTYQLVARGTGVQDPLTAVAFVEVTGSDVPGVSLVLAPPLSVAGRVVAAGATGASRAPSLAGHTLQFAPLLTSMTGIVAPRVTATSSNGEFTVSGLIPGRYVLTGAPFFGASNDSVSWGLDTVVVDGVDMTDRAFDIRADTLPKGFVVTFTDRWQDISGRVSNADGAGVSDYTMLAFPVDESYWLYNSRRIITAQPASDGRYQLGGPGPAILPAGEYYLAAVTDVSKDEQYDPAFLQSLIPAALRVTLVAGQRLTQDVRVQ
jgi:hypothetical protein